MPRWPWVSRRAYDLAIRGLEQSREDCTAMRAAISQLVERNVGLTDPWTLMQARIMERERREGNAEGEAGLGGARKPKGSDNLLTRI